VNRDAAARGRFIVLEGGDGCGKSTQAARLVRRLEARGRLVHSTFEPGATELGLALRELLLRGEVPVHPRAEALLMAADRAQHVADVVEPALTRGVWVVSDRFVGSSLAYQGAARGLGVAAIAAVNRFATAGLAPDLVVYLRAPVDVLVARRHGPIDRIEAQGVDFARAVTAAYDHLAVELDWAVVDGTPDPDTVEEAVWAEVDSRLAP
jgi:dTMP kinase